MKAVLFPSCPIEKFCVIENYDYSQNVNATWGHLDFKNCTNFELSNSKATFEIICKFFQ